MAVLTLTLLDQKGQKLGSITLPPGEQILGRELIAELGGGADPSVSRRHGRIFVRDGAHLVEDLGSRNGTFVGGRRVEGALPLAPGDQLEIGSHRFLIGDEHSPREESGRDLYASATIAAASAGASDRLRLVYELARMLDDPARPEAIAAHLETILARALRPASVSVLLSLEVEDVKLPFAKTQLRERVLGGGQVLRREARAGETSVIALPFGIELEPNGVVVASAGERGFSEDDVAFIVAATTLAASALARGAREASSTVAPADEILGESEAITRVKRTIDTIAPHADLSVLLVGETGTGKELFARRLHAASGRRGPFVAVNVAALPAELLESELFGHVKGAFTGADRARVGYIELAHGGTLFLDELGEMPAAIQVKLLRVLQERTINRVGDPRPINVDVRLVAATNAELEAKMREGSFREDLYYRIANQQTRIPPLRERGDDLVLLVRAFIAKNRSRVRDIEPEALATLRVYPWPGNVRQLEGTIRLAIIHAAADHAERIGVEHIDERVRALTPEVAPANGPLATELAGAERNVIVKALRASGGNKRAAARELGMSINTLRSRIERYGIEEKEYAD